jgi:hypothetical protein
VLPVRQYTYKLAIINVNGIVSQTRIDMLGGFLRGHDIDIALLQEVTNGNFASIPNYMAIVNEGTEQRGTAIIVNEGIPLSNIKRLPSGRGMAAMFMGTWIINIYAPSGAERRVERERFFNNEITYLLPSNATDMLLACEFNCVVALADCTGWANVSGALVTLIKGICLYDVWTTHTNNGAPRIDRIHVTENLRKQGTETLAAAFTDNLALLVRLAFDTPRVMVYRGHWRMNSTLLDDAPFPATFKDQWGRWQRIARHYPMRVLWWERYVKVKIRQTFQREGAERNKNRKELENLYYEAIQGESGGICNTLGNDSMRDSKQKSSYEHGSNFERLPRYGETKIGPSCEHKQQLRNKQHHT